MESGWTPSRLPAGAELAQDERGLSLVELVVALLLLGVVTSSGWSVATQVLNSYRWQAAHAQLQSSLRVGVSVIGSELRELGGGSADGDLIQLDSTAITYRAMRHTSFLCRPPDSQRREIVIWREPSYGLRQLEAGRDSILVFAENDPVLESDNAWLRAAIVSRARGTLCPGNTYGIRLGLAGVSSGSLTGVERGSPVRGFQVTRLLLYQDRKSVSWLGLKEWKGGSGWSVTQPVLGPLAPNGLRFEYLDGTGRSTTQLGDVAVVAITIVAQSNRRVARVGHLTDSLSTFVALRNVLQQ